jgi:adenylate cyclase
MSLPVPYRTGLTSVAIDFEREGLLKGTRGEAREARRELLAELEAEGVALEDLRRAVEEDRLVLLPVERLLQGSGPRYTAEEVAEEIGVERDVLQFLRQAIGLPVPEEGEAAFTQPDVEAARRVKSMIDAGLPLDEMLEVTRAMGVAMSQVAAASRTIVGSAVLEPGDTELDAAHRYRDAARALQPLMGPTLEYLFDVHLLSQIRNDAVGQSELAAGRPTSEEITVSFADLVGFTRFGERLDPTDLGALVGRLGELAGEIAVAPVRLVKMIGDAVMLVSRDNDALLEAALELVARAEAEGEGFPPLRAGLARGSALARAGDWYGRPVNLASRIAAIAYPGSVLVSDDVKQASSNGHRWSFAGERRLKGIDGRVRLHRVRTDG